MNGRMGEIPDPRDLRWGAIPPGTTRLEGRLATIRYHANGFLIGMLSHGVVVKGPMSAPQIGVDYVFKGAVVRDPKWGDQFSFREFEARIPEDNRGFVSYLVANAKWIGPSIAIRIWDAFGENSIRVCREDPDRVAREIRGISVARATEIAELLRGVQKNEAAELEIRKLLAGSGLGPVFVGRIAGRYGSDAARLVRENPYRLVEEIDGIGFLKADVLALRIGYEKTGTFRLRAAVVHVLEEAAGSEGHVCLPSGEIVRKAVELLRLEAPDTFKVLREIRDLVTTGKLVDEGGRIYLARLARDERSAAERISALLRREARDPTAYEAARAANDHPNELRLADDQMEAVRVAAESPFMVLTGAPGTGKTAAIRRIVDVLGRDRVELAAPTGKAAKRIEEQSGIPARTIHRLLEVAPAGKAIGTPAGGGFVFTRTAANPIEAELLVVDESSMLDVTLAARLFEAVGAGTRVVMVGDSYQLPSVGPGNVLGQLIASVPSVELTEIKRQSDSTGLIVRNCHRVKNGEPPDLPGDWNQDFVFVEREENLEILREIVRLVTEELPGREIREKDGSILTVNPVRDVQVIVPMRERTILSAAAFNSTLRDALNPKVPTDDPTATGFRVGDKVIQTRNDYANEIMNGDVGRVAEVDPEEDRIRVAFDVPPRIVTLQITKNELELAYALTCHKFQGSQAPIIVIPISRTFGPLVTVRNWLYTAISRAIYLCVLVGQRDEVAEIVGRNRPIRRWTRLGERIRKGAEG